MSKLVVNESSFAKEAKSDPYPSMKWAKALRDRRGRTVSGDGSFVSLNVPETGIADDHAAMRGGHMICG
jgi:hypothetical protein